MVGHTTNKQSYWFHVRPCTKILKEYCRSWVGDCADDGTGWGADDGTGWGADAVFFIWAICGTPVKVACVESLMNF